MTIAFVKVTKIEATSGNSASSATFSATAGNALFCCTHTYNNSTSSGTVTVSGGGGTWTSDASGSYVEFTTDHGDLDISSAPNNSGGTNTITSTDSVSPGGGLVVIVYEFSGVATSSMLDAAGTLKTGTVTPATTNSLTNTNANDVFIALLGQGGAGTMTGSGGSGSGTWVFPAGGEETSNTFPCMATGYDIVSATGAQNPSWTLAGNANWATIMVCYKAAGGVAFLAEPPLTVLQSVKRASYF